MRYKTHYTFIVRNCVLAQHMIDVNLCNLTIGRVSETINKANQNTLALEP